jgi:hypothetical protein
MTVQMEGEEPSPFDASAVFSNLRRLKASQRFRLTKHDLAQLLIAACISEGIDSGRRITGALQALGLNRQHAGMMLKDGTGDDPAFHWWFIDAGGRYALHERPPSKS